MRFSSEERGMGTGALEVSGRLLLGSENKFPILGSLSCWVEGLLHIRRR